MLKYIAGIESKEIGSVRFTGIRSGEAPNGNGFATLERACCCDVMLLVTRVVFVPAGKRDDDVTLSVEAGLRWVCVIIWDDASLSVIT